MTFLCNSKIIDKKFLVLSMLFFFLPLYSLAYTKVYSTSDYENREPGVIYEISHDNELYNAENRSEEEKLQEKKPKNEIKILNTYYYNPRPYYHTVIYNVIPHPFSRGVIVNYPNSVIYHGNSRKKYFKTLMSPVSKRGQQPNQ